MQAPSHLLRLTEPLRAAIDLSTLPFAMPWLSLPRAGDGHPVMVIPGFTAGGRSTKIIRDFLTRRGYNTSCWQQGTNMGVRGDLYDGAVEMLEKMHEESGRKVSLVGQSLGGIYAREMAKRHPHLVRQVISLGSPFNNIGGNPSKEPNHYKRFAQEQRQKSAQFRSMEWQPSEAPPMPTTAIFSKADGVCHWHTCRQHHGHSNTENVEVIGSHIGMGVNAQVLFVVADRLSQTESSWEPFKMTRYLGLS
jgi:pimeloyl-ACP methyl ester carboxylesterase